MINLSKIIQTAKRYLLLTRRNYIWILCLAGIAWCALFFILSIITQEYTLVNRASSIAVAATFIMLFLGRNDALITIIEPVNLVPLYVGNVENNINNAAEKLRAEKYANSDLVRELVNHMVILEGMRQKSVSSGDQSTAKRYQDMNDETISGLSGTKGISVETLLEARLAKSEALSNRTAMRIHLELLKREAWPLAILSVIGTVLTGYGDVLAQYVVKFFS